MSTDQQYYLFRVGDSEFSDWYIARSEAEAFTAHGEMFGDNVLEDIRAAYRQQHPNATEGDIVADAVICYEADDDFALTTLNDDDSPVKETKTVREWLEDWLTKHDEQWLPFHFASTEF